MASALPRSSYARRKPCPGPSPLKKEIPLHYLQASSGGGGQVDVEGDSDHYSEHDDVLTSLDHQPFKDKASIVFGKPKAEPPKATADGDESLWMFGIKGQQQGVMDVSMDLMGGMDVPWEADGMGLGVLDSPAKPHTKQEGSTNEAPLHSASSACNPPSTSATASVSSTSRTLSKGRAKRPGGPRPSSSSSKKLESANQCDIASGRRPKSTTAASEFSLPACELARTSKGEKEVPTAQAIADRGNAIDALIANVLRPGPFSGTANPERTDAIASESPPSNTPTSQTHPVTSGVNLVNREAKPASVDSFPTLTPASAIAAEVPAPILSGFQHKVDSGTGVPGTLSADLIASISASPRGTAGAQAAKEASRTLTARLGRSTSSSGRARTVPALPSSTAPSLDISKPSATEAAGLKRSLTVGSATCPSLLNLNRPRPLPPPPSSSGLSSASNDFTAQPDKRITVQPLDSFNRLGRSTSMSSRLRSSTNGGSGFPRSKLHFSTGRAESGEPAPPKEDEVLRPTRSIPRSGPVKSLALTSIATASKSIEAQDRPRAPIEAMPGEVRRASGEKRKRATAAAKLPDRRTAIVATSTEETVPAFDAEAKGSADHSKHVKFDVAASTVITAADTQAFPTQPKMSTEVVATLPPVPVSSVKQEEISLLDLSTGLSNTSACVAGPTCSTPFRVPPVTPGGGPGIPSVPLPPDTARVSTPRPKRNVSRKSNRRLSACAEGTRPSPPGGQLDKTITLECSANCGTTKAHLEAAEGQEDVEPAKKKPRVYPLEAAGAVVGKAVGTLPNPADPSQGPSSLLVPALTAKRRTSRVSHASTRSSRKEEATSTQRRTSPLPTSLNSGAKEAPPAQSYPPQLGLGNPPALTDQAPGGTAAANLPQRAPVITQANPAARPSREAKAADTAGKRTASQPALTMPREFTFTVPKVDLGPAIDNGEKKLSARERAEAKATERLKEKEKHSGVDTGGSQGWRHVTTTAPRDRLRSASAGSGLRKGKERVREDAEDGRVWKRQKSNRSEPSHPAAPANNRRIVSAPPSRGPQRVPPTDRCPVDGVLPVLPSTGAAPATAIVKPSVAMEAESLQRSTEIGKTDSLSRISLSDSAGSGSTAKTSDAAPTGVGDPADGQALASVPRTRGSETEKDIKVVEYLQGVQQAGEEARKTSSVHSTQTVSAVRARLPSTENGDLKEKGRAILGVRRANREAKHPPKVHQVGRSVSGNNPANPLQASKCYTKPASRISEASTSRNVTGPKPTAKTSSTFQDRLNQWRKAEARAPGAPRVPKPLHSTIPASRSFAEWHDVSLVHHLRPAEPKHTVQPLDLGLATQKRVKEREEWEKERAGREKRREEEEAERREEEAKKEVEELEKLKKALIPKARPVPAFYYES